MATTRVHNKKTVVRRFIGEIINDGNYEIADEVIAEEYVRHDPGIPDRQRDPDEFVEMVQTFRKAFPDARVTIEDMVAEDDLVVFRAIDTGTHKGRFMGVEPTGKSYEVTGLTMNRIEDGKLTETWANWDTLGMLEQLDITPDQLSG
ncbi:ester cyclase [Halocatena marina]|uniref:Ester cyclase n=1 Tax=Halocatena marina TaxID=2934937 RepID=A0ABD5YKG4_9EURY|nr:ester cyclase [Halocatena marina]